MPRHACEATRSNVRLGEAADIDCDMVEDLQTDAAAPRAGQPSRSAARNAPSAAHMSVRAVTGDLLKGGLVAGQACDEIRRARHDHPPVSDY